MAGTDGLLRQDYAALNKAFYRVCRAADKVLECANEFLPEYPAALCEYLDELDKALAEAAEAGHYLR